MTVLSAGSVASGDRQGKMNCSCLRLPGRDIRVSSLELELIQVEQDTGTGPPLTLSLWRPLEDPIHDN